MSNIKCIDVSCWQGNIDWKKVKAAGYGHAIIRAGFGREASQVDSKFEQNYKNAKAAGVKLGVYWYSYAVDKADAVREAKACLTVLKGKKLDMPVFFDMEESSMTKLGKSTLTAMAKGFCEAIESGGYRAGIYSNPNWFNNYLNYTELKKTYPIWLAQYHTEAQYECDVWQYTSSGKVNGISGSVDMNIIYNSGIIKSASTTTSTVAKTETKEVFEIAVVQALLRLAYIHGIAKTLVTPIDNKKGKLTNAAIIEAREYLGYKNPTSDIDQRFITDLAETLEDKTAELVKASLENLAGDFNGDGKVDIKDATAIQKHLAGIE